MCAQLFQHAFVVAAAVTVAVNNKTAEPLLFGHYLFREIVSNIFFSGGKSNNFSHELNTNKFLQRS